MMFSPSGYATYREDWFKATNPLAVVMRKAIGVTIQKVAVFLLVTMTIITTSQSMVRLLISGLLPEPRLCKMVRASNHSTLVVWSQMPMLLL